MEKSMPWLFCGNSNAGQAGGDGEDGRKFAFILAKVTAYSGSGTYSNQSKSAGFWQGCFPENAYIPT